MKSEQQDTYQGLSIMSGVALLIGVLWGGGVWVGWLGLHTYDVTMAFLGFWLLAVPLWIWWMVATFQRVIRRPNAPEPEPAEDFTPPMWFNPQPLARWKYFAGWGNVVFLSCLFFLNNYVHGCDGAAREVSVVELEQLIDAGQSLPGRHLRVPLAGNRIRCRAVVTEQLTTGNVTEDDHYCLLRSAPTQGASRVVLLLNQVPVAQRERIAHGKGTVQGVVRDVLWEGLSEEDRRILGAHSQAVLVEVGVSPGKLLANGLLVPGLVGLLMLWGAVYSFRQDQQIRKKLAAKGTQGS